MKSSAFRSIATAASLLVGIYLHVASGTDSAPCVVDSSCDQGLDSSTVVVDIKGHCMKVPNVQQNMHLSLGKEGTYTTGGTGELHDANGAKYQTKKDGKCNSESKDEDAIATGIAENDAVGKWIHKVNSTPGNGTRGCIGLLPKDFCLLKEEYTKKKGLKIKVCNSGHESTGVSKWWNKFKYNVKSFNGGKIDDSEHFEEDKKSTAPAAPAAR